MDLKETDSLAIVQGKQLFVKYKKECLNDLLVANKIERTHIDSEKMESLWRQSPFSGFLSLFFFA